MPDSIEHAGPDPVLRRLFAEYLEMYATRDDRLTTHFSENFSGFAGGGHVLVKDRAEWVAVTRQDFAQVREPLHIDVKDVSYQSLSDTVAVATGFLTIHLPIKDHILSRETARLVLIFHRESGDWKISHSSISIPYHLVREGEIYPLHELEDRNQFLEKLAAERTQQLSDANDSLRRSEELYRSILEASPDDITITDRAGRIVMASPAAARIFRCEPVERFLGLSLMDFVAPEDRARATSRAVLRQQGQLTGPSEYLGLRPDGSTFPIEVNSAFIRDAAGRATGMVVVVRDITERKQAEAEREKLAAQNRQLQKAESLGRMAGAVAHHFNNQLHAVMMSLELALGGLPPDSPAIANVTLARQSARKAAELSAQMLTYLGQTTSTPRDLDLAELCRRSLPLLHAVLPRGVTLTTDLPPAGPVVHADANQIQHVLTNLITNAWEACENIGGAVRLAVTTVPAAGVPAARRFPIGGRLDAATYACLTVADTGGGIPEVDLEKLFDPFFSRKFPGRGMGLAVALGVTRTHGGAIAVESTPGRGSTFRVFLPMAPPVA